MDECFGSGAELVEHAHRPEWCDMERIPRHVRGRSELYFQDPDPDVNLVRWSVLNHKKAELARAFGGELIFDDLPHNKGCRIEARLNGAKIADKAQWPAIISWMVDTQERLRKAVHAVGGIPIVTAAVEPGGDDAASAQVLCRL